VPVSASSDARFPSTRHSLLRALGSDDTATRREALEALVAVYWRPVYARYRVKWAALPADAEDMTQEFFTRVLDDGSLERYDPSRARFRTYLRTCADRFAANALRDRTRLKRGGGVVLVPIETAELERELAYADGATHEDPDAWFEREWVRGVFGDAVSRLQEDTAGTAREIRVTLLQRYDLEPRREEDRPSYQVLATEFGLPVTQVTNHLAWARRELRRLVLERLRSLAGSDAEYDEDVRAVLGARP
jgi:RNA polymerase sigma-70 factor (ECF subfamily)